MPKTTLNKSVTSFSKVLFKLTMVEFNESLNSNNVISKRFR